MRFLTADTSDFLVRVSLVTLFTLYLSNALQILQGTFPRKVL